MSRYTKSEFVAKENITNSILNNWIYRHELPIIQIGRRTYIDEEDFQAWLSDHKKVFTQKVSPEQVTSTPPQQCKDKKTSKFLSKLRLAR